MPENKARRRKGGEKRKTGEDEPVASHQTSSLPGPDSADIDVLKWGFGFIGLIVCISVGYYFWQYMQNLHENHLWFTNIKEVEREISLRTECGLYYSYYKQLIKAPTLVQGISDLTRDNSTEHGRTINILERFNIYQEVILAAIYRGFNLWETMDPILFYTYSCFFLTGVGLSFVFLLTWYLSGTWIAGLLAAAYFTVNLDDATRVFFTVNLREIFAFPFLWAQILCICMYLERRRSTQLREALILIGIGVFSFLFAICWQFNQFVFLIQCLSLYGVGVLQLAPVRKIQNILVSLASALLGVFICQFGQPMLLGSLVLSFIPVAAALLQLCRSSEHYKIGGGIFVGGGKVFLHVCITLACTFLLNLCIKSLLQLEADAHIFKFLKGKFGLASPRDFEARIYLCHGAFVFLDMAFFRRTSLTLLFPVYILVLCISLFIMGKDLLYELFAENLPKQPRHQPIDPQDPSDKRYFFNRHPYLGYLVVQSCLSGVVAMMTLRMKYLWVPHMCVLSAFGVSSLLFWEKLLCWFKIRSKSVIQCARHAVPILIGVIIIWRYLPIYNQQMGDLKEFWDPDTVELMEWINNNTQEQDSFAGSMQLLAGVKCCTGRHLTNHPHFEDKWLRQRTKQVYQIYGRLPPKEVHSVLKSVEATYIILEDSICLAPSDLCRTPDLIDLENGHIPDNQFSMPGLVKGEHPRFCDEIRHETTAYSRLFQLVMENKTFRVYKLL